MAANLRDVEKLVDIAERHVRQAYGQHGSDEVVRHRLRLMVQEMSDAVAQTANKSVRDTLARLLAECLRRELCRHV